MKMHPAQYRAYEKGKTFIGVSEIPGPTDNPKIVKWFDDTGNGWVLDDETPWCAAFVGSMLEQSGLRSTRKLNARSYLDWGSPVRLADARNGDIVAFWRGRKDGWEGHVGFYSGQTTANIKVLGGNQGNKVSHALYGKDRLLGIRRYPLSTDAAPENESCWTRFFRGAINGGQPRNER